MTEETYLIPREDIEMMQGVPFEHFLNSNAQRVTKSLGDVAGLSGFGFNIVETAPGRETTEYHHHQSEDEAVYVLSGQGEAIVGNDRFLVQAGDFIGYRKGGLSHVITNCGEESLRCIVVGERRACDVVDYPRKHTRLYIHTGLQPGVVAFAHIGSEKNPKAEAGANQNEAEQLAIAQGTEPGMGNDTYLITKKEIEAMDGLKKTHFLNSRAVRINKSLGDLTGLTGLGFHIIEVDPGRETTEYHRHYHEDECIYILSGRATATIGDREHAVKAGDFIGYRKGGLAHTIENTGNDILRCIVVGERLAYDVGDYPRLKKRIYRQVGLTPNLVDHEHIDEPTVGAKT